MAKNYQITHKLHSKSIANLSTNIYVATYLPNRDSVTLKITDLEELNDIQLILVKKIKKIFNVFIIIFI